MNIEVVNKCIVHFRDKYEEFEDWGLRWRDDDAIVTMDSHNMTPEMIKDVEEYMIEHAGDSKNCKKCANKILNRRKIFENISDNLPIKKLNSIPDMLKAYFEKNEKTTKYSIFKNNKSDKTLLPCVIIDAKYYPPSREREQYTQIELGYFRNNKSEKTNIYFHTYDLNNSPTIPELLEEKGYFVGTEDLWNQYDEDKERFSKIISVKGKQYIASNAGYEFKKYSNSRHNFLEGNPNKVVVDYFGYYELEENKSSNDYQDSTYKSLNLFDGKNFILPIHFYTNVFSLDKHKWLNVHISNLEEYIYKGKELEDKLVLPKEHKELINILMQMSKIQIEDIIDGKVGGSFILSTGEPGTGKTLTAEVFSETVGIPLYSVQCSQLGLKIETIEENLNKVLERASRWGALLLIDEADVYIRKRGTDIHQNAIVGTFLRVLEYYTGILFMTTNLGDDIDDAIVSRATVKIKYKRPTKDEQRQLWNIIANQFKINPDLLEIESLIEEIIDPVGRDIKGLLKLGKMQATHANRDLVKNDLLILAKYAPNLNKEN